MRLAVALVTPASSAASLTVTAGWSWEKTRSTARPRSSDWMKSWCSETGMPPSLHHMHQAAPVAPPPPDPPPDPAHLPPEVVPGWVPWRSVPAVGLRALVAVAGLADLLPGILAAGVAGG